MPPRNTATGFSNLITFCSQDNNLCAYSIEYGRTSDYLEAHSDAISCMDWRSGVLATGSWDSTVKLWQCSEVNGYR